MSPPVLDRSRAVDAGGRQRSARTRPFALPEVRWATVATVLFVLGLAAQFGAPRRGLWWALYLACYVTGGWEPALAGLQALREQDPGRGPADDRGRDRRGGDRAGPRRRRC